MRQKRHFDEACDLLEAELESDNDDEDEDELPGLPEPPAGAPAPKRPFTPEPAESMAWTAARAAIQTVQESMRVEYALLATRVAKIPGRAWQALEFIVAAKRGQAMCADAGRFIRSLVDDGSTANAYMYERDVWSLDCIGVPERRAALEGTQVKLFEKGKVGADVIQNTVGGACILERRIRERQGMPHFVVKPRITCDAEVTDSVLRPDIAIDQVKLSELLNEARAIVNVHAATLSAAGESSDETPDTAAPQPPRQLREWQVDFASWALRSMRRDKPLVLSAAGGLGKTVAGAYVGNAHTTDGAVVVWVTPHRTLVSDAVAELRRAGRAVFVLGDSCAAPRERGAAAAANALQALVVVARSAALKMPKIIDWIADRPYALLIDEAHRLVTPRVADDSSGADSAEALELPDVLSQREAVESLMRGAELGALAMTATPKRLNVPEEDTYRLSYSYGVDRGLLVPYRVTAAVMTRNDATAWAEHLADNRTMLPAIIVCSDHAAIDEQLRECRRLGLVCETINSRQCSVVHRDRVQARLRDPATALRDPLDVLVVHRCCIEGVDYPLVRTTAFRHLFGVDVDVQQAALRPSRVAGGGKREAHLMVPFVTGPVADGTTNEELAAAVDGANHAGLAQLCGALLALEDSDDPDAQRRIAERCEVDARTYFRAAARGCAERGNVMRRLEQAGAEPGRALCTVVVDALRRAAAGTSIADLALRDEAIRTAQALHDRDREGDDWRKQAKAVARSAATAARREGKSEAAQEAARAKARDDHIAAHGVPSGTARVCAGTLLFNMRAGQRDAVLAALREIADAQPETETRGAKRLVTEIEAARAAEQPV